MDDVVATGLVIGIVVLVGLLIAGATFVGAQWAARHDQRLDRDLRPLEAASGRCALCDGTGVRFGDGRRGPHTCWRCDGSGLAFPVGVGSRRHLRPGGPRAS